MENDHNRNDYKFLFTAFLCLVLCGYYYYFFFNRAYVEVDLQVSKKTFFKLYWAADNERFSEKHRSLVKVTPNQTHYTFFLSDLDKISKIRIDPHQYEGEASISKLTISQKGFRQFSIDFNKVKPLFDIFDYEAGSDQLRVVSSGNDPNFSYDLILERERINWFAEALIYVLICLIIVLFLHACQPLQVNFLYIPAMLAMVLALVVTMAAVSKRNVHPDEYVHLDATAYYHDRWLPPGIDDRDIEHTYSVYGISRLNNGEIYYLLAGKVSKFFNTFKINQLFSLRIFNSILFAFIVLFTIRSVPARVVALPFLISPQIWYIFSYCGSDAFALFICFIAGCELVRPQSYLNRLLQTEGERSLILPTLLISFLLALLFLLKKNYYPFIVFFYFLILLQIYKTSDRGAKIIVCKRIVLVTLLAIVIAAIRIGADYHVNGFDRSQKLHAMQEKMAHPWYKPSTELHKKHISLNLKDRGTTLNELIKRDKWFQKNFVTGFGVYGYFTIAAPKTFYNLVKWAAIFLLFYIYLVLFVRGGLENSAIGILAAVLSIALIAVSLHHSWTRDFQAQGRYLFPIVPIFGIVLGRARHLFNTRLFTLGVTQMYALALYSFIFIAILSIPR